MGICTVFVVLGGILTIANSSFGWGFQFPIRLVFGGCKYCVGVYDVLNLWDKFYIQIPIAVIRLIPSGTSENYNHLLMGWWQLCWQPRVPPHWWVTALGFAMGLGACMSMLIFVSMGLGMALPYLILYIFPALNKKIA